MTYLLGLSIASNAVLLVVFLRYLLDRDERECRERAKLLNRVQAPDTAVAQTLLAEEKFDKPYRSEADELAGFEEFVDG